MQGNRTPRDGVPTVTVTVDEESDRSLKEMQELIDEYTLPPAPPHQAS